MTVQAINDCAPYRCWQWVALCAWGALTLIGWWWLESYGQKAGSLHEPPRLDTVDGSFPRTVDRHLLVMAIHPKCPCSRASATELERLIAKFRHELTCVVLVYRPKAQPEDWVETGLVAALRRRPATTIVVDTDGRLSARLGMSTSGAVILYSRQGIPLYWGGITAGRGHCGDNLGSDAIAAVLSGQASRGSTHPVYGCAIYASEHSKQD